MSKLNPLIPLIAPLLLPLLIVILFCSGCRTFTNTQLKTYTANYIEKAYIVGYKEGKKRGFYIGKIYGLAQSLDIKLKDPYEIKNK